MWSAAKIALGGMLSDIYLAERFMEFERRIIPAEIGWRLRAAAPTVPVSFVAVRLAAGPDRLLARTRRVVDAGICGAGFRIAAMATSPCGLRCRF